MTHIIVIIRRKAYFILNAVKKSKNSSPFFSAKLSAQIILLLQLKTIQVFKIAKFEFQVAVHYGLWAKWTQL